MLGLVGGAIVLLLLLVAAGFIVARNAVDDVVTTMSSTTLRSGRSTTSLFPATTRRVTPPTGPTTSVAGTGAVSPLTNTQASRLVQEGVQSLNPGMSVGLALCPRAPYRVGHVMDCRVRLETSSVLYRATVSDEQSVDVGPTKPIVDTEKAEAEMEAKEPGTTAARCPLPRIRQLDVGEQITCRSASSTWDFTVGADGALTGTPR